MSLLIFRLFVSFEMRVNIVNIPYCSGSSKVINFFLNCVNVAGETKASRIQHVKIDKLSENTDQIDFKVWLIAKHCYRSVEY